MILRRVIAHFRKQEWTCDVTPLFRSHIELEYDPG